MIYRLRLWLLDLLKRRVMSRRPPDFMIGGHENPYLCRWWLLPRNPFFNIYLHLFLRSDDDRALHDHPWFWASWILSGAYIEHLRSGKSPTRIQGSFRLGHPWRLHRVELFHRWERNGKAHITELPVVTLFFTGPSIRKWGFQCPQGWVYWKKFVAGSDKGAIGKGCDQ